MRLHVSAERAEVPLSEDGMALALYLNAGVAVAGLVSLWLAGVAGWAAAAVAALAFVILNVALFHRMARWLSVACGTALSIGVGVALGGASRPGALGVAGGAAIGLVVAAAAYGRFVAAALRPRAPQG
jgi:hypothetical protein